MTVKNQYFLVKEQRDSHAEQQKIFVQLYAILFYEFVNCNSTQFPIVYPAIYK